MAKHISKNGKVYYSSDSNKAVRSAFTGTKGKELDFRTDAEISEKLNKRFDVLNLLTNQCISGSARSLIVYGPAGVGKSYGVETALASADCIHTIVKGFSTKIGLLRTLYRYRHPGNVIVFDDCDAVLYDETCLGLLKAVCDTTDKRTVSYMTNATIYPEDDELNAIPPTFEFEGTVIFITNTDFENPKPRLAEHTAAMISRSHYIDLQMKSKRDYIVRIKQVIAQGLFNSLNLTEAQSVDVVRYIEDNTNELRELSLRVALKIGGLRKDSPDNWMDIADITVKRNG